MGMQVAEGVGGGAATACDHSPLHTPSPHRATLQPPSEFIHGFKIGLAVVPWAATSSSGWHICCSSEDPQTHRLDSEMPPF